jgi:hypothetical protein
LALDAGGGRDDDARLCRSGAAELRYEASHARILGDEAVPVDQVLVDRDGVPPMDQRVGDELAIGLARTGARRARWRPSRWTPAEWWPDLTPSRWTPPLWWPVLAVARFADGRREPVRESPPLSGSR